MGTAGTFALTRDVCIQEAVTGLKQQSEFGPVGSRGSGRRIAVAVGICAHRVMWAWRSLAVFTLGSRYALVIRGGQSAESSSDAVLARAAQCFLKRGSGACVAVDVEQE